MNSLPASMVSRYCAELAEHCISLDELCMALLACAALFGVVGYLVCAMLHDYAGGEE